MRLQFWKKRTQLLDPKVIRSSDWRQNPELVSSARAIISDPTFKLMMGSVRASVLSSMESAQGMPDAARLKAFDNSVGALVALRQLESLAKPQSKSDPIEATYSTKM